MRKPTKFYDPFGKTSLSGRKTLLFCAYYHFIIPHDIVGAILYDEVLYWVEKAHIDGDFREFLETDPSMYIFIAEIDWYLGAISSMGYQDIVDEFHAKEGEVKRFVEERSSDEPCDINTFMEMIISIIPPRYLRYLDNNIKQLRRERTLKKNL